MHHSFIDYLWEQFRQNRQTRDQREREWPRVSNQVQTIIDKLFRKSVTPNTRQMNR